MASNTKPGKRVVCRKCKRPYYLSGTGKYECPYCVRAKLLPAGEIIIAQLGINPGGYNDAALCLDNDLASKAASGAIYLRCAASVIVGAFKGTKISVPISISSPQNQNWEKRSRDLIIGLLNSSQGLDPVDMGRNSTFGRIIESYRVLDGIVFVAQTGISKQRGGREQNTIDKILTVADEEYRQLISGKKFAPAVKTLPAPNASNPLWISR